MLLIYIVCDVKAGLVTITSKMVVHQAVSLVMSLVVFSCVGFSHIPVVYLVGSGPQLYQFLRIYSF